MAAHVYDDLQKIELDYTGYTIPVNRSYKTPNTQQKRSIHKTTTGKRCLFLWIGITIGSVVIGITVWTLAKFGGMLYKHTCDIEDILRVITKLQSYKDKNTSDTEDILRVITKLQSDKDKKIYDIDDVLRIITKLQSDKDNVKPVFFASLKAHPYILRAEDDVIKFDDVRINIGAGYSSSSGYFTAARKGIYQFSCMLLGENGNLIRFQINKNNEVFTYGHVARGEYESQTITSMIEMNKGDRVFIKHRTTDVQQVYGNHHSTFSGYFMQE